MCHGQMIGRKVMRARKAKACNRCDRPFVAGDRIVREIVLSFEEGKTYPIWLCFRCSVEWEHVTSQESFCPTEPREFVKDEANEIGWKAMLGKLRAARARVLRGL